MTLEQIQHFLMVAEQMSFTKASKSAFISQSSLSRHIASLESTLGVKLFVRRKQQICLTEAGKILYEEGMLLMDSIQSIEDRIKRIACGQAGSLIISSPQIYYEPLFNIYQEFTSRYDSIHFHLVHAAPDHLVDSIRKGKADISMVFEHMLDKDLEGYTLRTLCRDSFAVLVAETHQMDWRSPIGLEALSRFDKLYTIRNFGCTLSQNGKAVDMASLGNVVEEDMETLIMMVKAGAGGALLPRMVAYECSAGGTVLELSVDSPLVLGLLSDNENANPAVELFFSLLDERSSEMRTHSPNFGFCYGEDTAV